ncbi:MAG: hypothetical protein KDI53_08340, partial [Candidatus Accumulibacter sp.]|nr:hypothetical protein [Accumulibacter sp.]
GMGVLPLQFMADDSAAALELRGDESFEIHGLGPELAPLQNLTLVIERADGDRIERPVLCRIDTPVEVHYYWSGGILPYVLEQLLGAAAH